jgi:hypothetical protein
MKPMPRLGDVPFRASREIELIGKKNSINWNVIQGIALTLFVAAVFWGGLFWLIAEAVG